MWIVSDMSKIYTYQEIADEIGVTHQAVWEIEKRALMKLRKIFINRGILREHYYD